MRTTRHCLNIVISGALAFGRGESFDDILSEMGNGAMTGAVLGAVSGFVSGIQYAREHKISPWTGEKTHGHHSFPKSLGGAVDQELTPMSASRHQDLHRELNQYLKTQTTEKDGKTVNMYPRKGYDGNAVRKNFSASQRYNAVKSFYDMYPIKYYDARFQFYKNNRIIRQCRPW